MKCEYCNLDHPINKSCPDYNFRDKFYASAGHKITSNWREPTYGQKLSDGFSCLNGDDNIIVDKFGYIHGSGG